MDVDGKIINVHIGFGHRGPESAHIGQIEGFEQHQGVVGY